MSVYVITEPSMHVHVP